jgi:hypothetical protein
VVLGGGSSELRRGVFPSAGGSLPSQGQRGGKAAVLRLIVRPIGVAVGVREKKKDFFVILRFSWTVL